MDGRNQGGWRETCSGRLSRRPPQSLSPAFRYLLSSHLVHLILRLFNSPRARHIVLTETEKRSALGALVFVRQADPSEFPLQPSLPSPSIQSQLHHGLSSSSRPILRVCRDGIVRLWYVPSGLELAILICLIASVSPPAWDQVNFLSATAGGTKTVFGVLGECVKGGSCTDRNVGYNLMVNGAT